MWGEAAVDVRRELRERGVVGRLRRLEDRARGASGDGVARQLYFDALDEARNGLPLEVALAKTSQVVALTVKLAYEEAERERSQGPQRSA
jgi:hypothetical protein